MADHRDIYRLQRARFDRLADEVSRRIAVRLRSESIRHFITFRSKHPDDVAEKITRKRAAGKQKYVDLEHDIGEVMTDLAGVRVVIYEPEFEARAADVILGLFSLSPGPVEDVHFVRPAHERRGGGDGYRATHLLVSAPEGDPLIAGATCEIQICNIVAHVFNEFEHDIAYKKKNAIPSQKTHDALEVVRAQTRELEASIARLMKAHKRDVQLQEVELNDASELKQGLESALARPMTGDWNLLFFLLRAFRNPLNVKTIDIAAVERRGRQLCADLAIEKPEDATVLGLGWADRRKLEAAELLDGRAETSEQSSQLVDALRKLLKGSA